MGYFRAMSTMIMGNLGKATVEVRRQIQMSTYCIIHLYRVQVQAKLIHSEK